MNRDLTLRVLADVMKWDNDRAVDEYTWLSYMGSMKYDNYRDFQAGMRFIESLATWLQQFPTTAERETAYKFVRQRLVYVGIAEMHHLVEQFYPRIVHPWLVSTVAERAGLKNYEAIARQDLLDEVALLRRKTLFLGLSDGARIDVLRHNNVGRISNEQIVHTTEPDAEKWLDVLKNLQEDTGDADARFEAVYLVDDFTGTSTSFLRPTEDPEKPWKGKLVRFIASIADVRDRLLAPNWSLCIHHYIASHFARENMLKNLDDSRSYFAKMGWGGPRVSFGMVLTEDFPLDASRGDADFIALTDRYYDPAIQTKATDVGGVKRINLGYGGCALPLVLEHNTPNNSVALLWAETAGKVEEGVHAMRPLFRRRQRHVENV